MIKSAYIKTYTPLVTDFANSIRSMNYDKMTEPFLPKYGALYETAPTRIAFVGMEANGWGNMNEFIKNVDINVEDAIFRGFEDFNNFSFSKWGTNFGRSFWDFIFKFLAAYYEIEDWKKLKRLENKDVLKTFAWANTNALERYQVAAQNNGVTFENWQQFKQLSTRFDNGEYLLNSLKPNIMVILNWTATEDWLIHGNEGFVKNEIDDHLRYYYLNKTKTHVLWTAHPTWLSKNKKNHFDNFIKYLVKFAKNALIDINKSCA